MKFVKSFLFLLTLSFIVNAETIGEKVSRYIDKSRDKFSFDQIDTVQYGSLSKDSVGKLDVELLNNGDYFIFSVCDSNCTDIDMFFLDDDNNVLAADTHDDAHPIIVVSLQEKRNHKIRVVMSSCSSSYCGYSIIILRKERSKI